ncbi:MAG: hypothetical protein H0V17_35345 [Deltaproteobacteria bacterium]|nr:hypothetical protein [Deltaproteobacteria bacterium]
MTNRTEIQELPSIAGTDLASASGGMRWEDFRPSQNVEDRRGWTRRQHNAVPPSYLPTPQVGPRTPGDLPSQAGLDDLISSGKKRRR